MRLAVVIGLGLEADKAVPIPDLPSRIAKAICLDEHYLHFDLRANVHDGGGAVPGDFHFVLADLLAIAHDGEGEALNLRLRAQARGV